jgi:hypothetical protein
LHALPVSFTDRSRSSETFEPSVASPISIARIPRLFISMVDHMHGHLPSAASLHRSNNREVSDMSLLHACTLELRKDWSRKFERHELSHTRLCVLCVEVLHHPRSSSKRMQATPPTHSQWKLKTRSASLTGKKV